LYADVESQIVPDQHAGEIRAGGTASDNNSAVILDGYAGRFVAVVRKNSGDFAA
jgi:hypothetical protein